MATRAPAMITCINSMVIEGKDSFRIFSKSEVSPKEYARGDHLWKPYLVRGTYFGGIIDGMTAHLLSQVFCIWGRSLEFSM